MTAIGVLTSPSANRVYARDTARLGLAELGLLEGRLSGSLGARSVRELGGVEYLWIEDPSGLSEEDYLVLSNLSCTYALFASEGDEALRPLPVTPLAFFDSDLVSIQRYAGKTNEQFTHLLVNVALAVSQAAAERSAQGRPVRLLDPLAGRGTTLNRGLMYGFDVTGIEIDGGDVEAYKGFLTTYLRDHGRRHRLEESTVKKGPLAGTRRWSVVLEGGQRIEMVKGDTLLADELFAARRFDVLVADLPYGVQHGASAAGRWARSPEELLSEAIPRWAKLLRAGAGLALSWNLRTAGRERILDLLSSAGFEVLATEDFDHRVDRSVTRAVAVARK
jgi:hypothetical protein